MALARRYRARVALHAELRDKADRTLRGLPDPAGGTFDAAGDFDSLVGADDDLPVWSSVDPYDDVTLTTPECGQLLGELSALSTRARPGTERRGLDRLRVLAERCSQDESLVLVFVGD